MEVLRKMIEEGDNKFWGYLGCTFLGAENGEIRIGLQAEEHHTNSMGIIHGGVLTALMDQAMGMAATSSRQQDACVTTNLNVHFLSAMHKGKLEVRARVIHEAGRTITTEAELRDEKGTLGCMATATFRVLRSTPAK
ncbi:PaaI family thioesterase [Paenibacillus sp. P96]|uniref:PaaI family thioesterase n=1 Tax=Paenibacillus zeirhizosphaerae TaxID=2987519 RepID=A0ABT9FRU2_9BACL|nr:PaaI family thioesterase [Paenibacillus sp. P96]MDP4097461.1 PaaI family thioesterase [Paenibacillus sp. P96]